MDDAATGEKLMTAEQNKDLISKTWNALLGGDLKLAMNNFADNISWLVPGNLPGASGLKRGKDEIAAFMRGVSTTFPEGLKTEFRRVYCDGDTVIVELTNRGKTARGKQYENEYCFVFEIEGGKIRRIREYVDTQKAHDLLFG
jgi:uncharacterized protein